MTEKMRAGNEAFPTLQALVWLLARVNPFMADKAGARNEALPALGALERFLSRVGPLVGDEGCFLPEAFATT